MIATMNERKKRYIAIIRFHTFNLKETTICEEEIARRDCCLMSNLIFDFSHSFVNHFRPGEGREVFDRRPCEGLHVFVHRKMRDEEKKRKTNRIHVR